MRTRNALLAVVDEQHLARGESEIIDDMKIAVAIWLAETEFRREETTVEMPLDLKLASEAFDIEDVGVTEAGHEVVPAQLTQQLERPWIRAAKPRAEKPRGT